MSKEPIEDPSLIGMIADEDTITGFLLAGVGQTDRARNRSNFYIVNHATPISDVEQAFTDMTSRNDISILLISQFIANDIRHLLDSYSQLYPTILEIPSKNQPYDPNKDSMLQKIKRFVASE
eukprot:TRINITY_DN3329_c0_g2_i5.p1 TRINITY_DN3329_c0_g2~~TRINITY_DN3329_c0_g2_i5.p1  ORF type:complete len:122 (-),score=25.16 TRINITY_DN3329_c0_g2_i5:419-784(-)